MAILVYNLPAILDGFAMTLMLFAVSAVICLVLGIMLAVMRVVPIQGLNLFAGFYVTVIRNAPPVLIFFIVTLGLPVLGVRLSFFTYAVIALSVYEASFICEAVRSGINFVPAGQSEAARSIGMTGTQMLRYVVMPQALANSVPAICNYLIALCKATSIAGTFGVVEATITLKYIAFENPGDVFVIFMGIAAGYIVINTSIAALLRLYEAKVSVLT